MTLSLGPLMLEVTERADTVAQVQLAAGRCPHVSPLGPQITADLLSNGIDVYPQKEFDEDAEDRLVNEKFRVSESPRRPVLLEGMAGVFLTHGGSEDRRGDGLAGVGALSGQGSQFWGPGPTRDPCTPLGPPPRR